MIILDHRNERFTFRSGVCCFNIWTHFISHFVNYTPYFIKTVNFGEGFSIFNFDNQRSVILVAMEHMVVP